MNLFHKLSTHVTTVCMPNVKSLLFKVPKLWQRVNFYAPRSNDRGHIVFVLFVCLSVCLSVCLPVCLSVCLSVVNFNLRYNFWTVRDRDFIFGMHTSTNNALSNDTKINDLVTLTLTLKLKIAFSTLLPLGAYCSVSQTHLDFFFYKQTNTDRTRTTCPQIPFQGHKK